MTDAFKAQMRRLVGLKFQPASLDTHWEALRDMPEALLAAAVEKAQRESDEFPSPSVLRAFGDLLRATVLPLPALEDRGKALPVPVVARLPSGGSLPITREWVYYCDDCSDTGWKTWWCGPGQPPGSLWVSVCQRTNEHEAHWWVGRCACAGSNPAVKRKRESEIQMATKRAEQSR